MRAMTPFSTLLASAVAAGDVLELAIPGDWGMGRSVFGGLQAAFAVRAMRAHVEAAIPLRALQVTFVGPASGTLRATATVLRRGSSATQIEARVYAGDAIATIVTGVFGAARPSQVSVMPTRPDVTSERTIEIPFVRGITPEFIQHFSSRWLRGAFPFSGSTDRSHVIEVGMRDIATVATEEHVIAIADVPPPIGLSFLRAPANGASATWMLELVDVGQHGLAGWRLDVELAAARDGYTNQSLVVWAPDGTPAAFGRQTMMVFG
jgi:hypothetical protein